MRKKFKDQKKAQEKIDQLQTSISEEERKRNDMEEKLNSTKTFDALKEQESYLQRLNEEDQAIIQDEMASSFAKKLLKKELRLEMKSSQGFKLGLRKEKMPCLSKKGSARSSKNMA